MTLGDLVNSLNIVFLGNRVTLASRILFATIAYSSHEDYFSHPAVEIAEAVGLYSTVMVEALTLCGYSTMHYYNRTMNHINEFGKLDGRYIKQMIKGTENRKFIGYCQIQGMYLAAKKAKQLETFKRVKAEVCNNIIPNF